MFFLDITVLLNDIAILVKSTKHKIIIIYYAIVLKIMRKYDLSVFV